MKFTGQIRVPEIDHPGVPATFLIEGSQAEVILEGEESLGRWSLYDVHARRLVASAFQIDLDGEEITFLADEPMDFAYRGVEHMAGAWARFRSMNLARRLVAVARSRKGVEPSRIDAFRTAMEDNLQAQTDGGRLAGSEGVVVAASAHTPESVAREVGSLPPTIGSSPQDGPDPGIPLVGEPVDTRSASESDRIAEERRAIEEDRARLEEQRRQLEEMQSEAERREADRVEAYRLEMKRLESERAEYQRLEQEREASMREAMERLEAERGEVERKSAEQQEREREEARRASALQAKLDELEEQRSRREQQESERVSAARARMEELEERRRRIERLEKAQEAEAAERRADDELVSREPAATADEPGERSDGVVDLDHLEAPEPAKEPPRPQPQPGEMAVPAQEPATDASRHPEPVMAVAAEQRHGGIMGAVRTAFGRGGNDHAHDFVDAPGGIGITRAICQECGYVSISTGD